MDHGRSTSNEASFRIPVLTPHAPADDGPHILMWAMPAMPEPSSTLLILWSDRAGWLHQPVMCLPTDACIAKDFGQAPNAQKVLWLSKCQQGFLYALVLSTFAAVGACPTIFVVQDHLHGT